MKKLTKLFTVLMVSMLAAAVGLTSCSDDDDNGNANEIKIDGKTLDLTKGEIAYYGPWEDSYNYDITLLSSSLSLNDMDGISGTGDIIYFESFTAAEELKAGTYIYSEDVRPGTFDMGSIYINYNASTDEVDHYYMVSGGSYTVSMDGSNYTITFNLQAKEANWDTEEFISVDTKTLLGEFHGTLDYSDVSNTKSIKKNQLFIK